MSLFFFWTPLKRGIPKSYLFWCIFLHIFRKVTCFDVPFSTKFDKLPVLMYLSQDSPKSYLFWCTFFNKFRKVRYLFWCTFLNKFQKVTCFEVPFSINSEKLPVLCTFLKKLYHLCPFMPFFLWFCAPSEPTLLDIGLAAMTITDSTISHYNWLAPLTAHRLPADWDVVLVPRHPAKVAHTNRRAVRSRGW